MFRKILIVIFITLALFLSAVSGLLLWGKGKIVERHVVINEFYEGRDKPGWVELYNPTDEKINVSYWRFYVLGIYGPFIPMNYGWHYIYPHEYVLIGNNRSTLEKYWNIPKGVRCIYFPAVIAPIGDTNRSGMYIEALNNLTGSGKLVDKVPPHEILPNGHSWARYVGDYQVGNNFTSHFYDEPNPTPGYKNHRSKESGENNGNEIYWIAGNLYIEMEKEITIFLLCILTFCTLQPKPVQWVQQGQTLWKTRVWCLL